MGFRCIQISKTFYSQRGKVDVLDSVDFSVQSQEFVCIVGPSGCGKTTLLKLVAGLIQPSAGKIIFSDDLLDGQLRSAMVFQEQALFPWMNVLDNVAFGLEAQGIQRQERRVRALEMLAKIGLDAFQCNFPHELSRGMRQRVAILRAFIANPQILLMDEPFGALDSQMRLVMQEELLRIWKEDRKTVLYVTHDIDEAIMLGDRILVMSGRPSKIRQEIEVPLGRPRCLVNRDHPNVVEIRWRIWKMLEDEVRKELYIAI
ncbi:MAG: ABC transporter ATP-binding protein [Anaerolineales bacterium]|nr:ABC transporter ATP-binding protein [Anaerolineales bacterium]